MAWTVVVIGAVVGSSSSEGGVPCVRWLFQPTLVWGEVGYLVRACQFYEKCLFDKPVVKIW